MLDYSSFDQIIWSVLKTLYTNEVLWAKTAYKTDLSAPFLSYIPWWRHQMEKFSAWLAICAGNSSIPGEFSAHKPVMRSFGVFFDLHPNKWSGEKWWGGRFKTSSGPLWRHRYALKYAFDEYLGAPHLSLVLRPSLSMPFAKAGIRHDAMNLITGPVSAITS